jgi:hypothetical protein
VVVVGHLARPLPARASAPPRAARVRVSALRWLASHVAAQAAAITRRAVTPKPARPARSAGAATGRAECRDRAIKATARLTVSSLALLGDDANATWKQLDQNVITKIVRRTFELLSMRITKRKLAAALPIIGIAIGATLNARTLSNTADAADLLYRQQFLCDKYNLPFPTRESQYTADAQDGEDIVITDIIEQEVDGEDGEHPPAPLS